MSIGRFALLLAALALFAGAAPAKPAVSLALHVERTSLDLLDSVAIAVVARNPGAGAVTLQFPAPQEEVVEVLDRAGAVIWSSAASPPPRGVTFPPHSRGFVPGPTPVVIAAWNALTSGGWSPLPGHYTVRARLLNEGAQPEASAEIAFAAPLPPSALPALHAGEAVTLSGKLDPTKGLLAEGSAVAPLSVRINAAPAGVPIVVRGYPVDGRDGSRTFTPTRWAPLGPPPASP